MEDPATRCTGLGTWTVTGPVPPRRVAAAPPQGSRVTVLVLTDLPLGPRLLVRQGTVVGRGPEGLAIDSPGRTRRWTVPDGRLLGWLPGWASASVRAVAAP